MTARIRITLADHFALQTWNAQTAQSAQTMQGGLQTTLTVEAFFSALLLANCDEYGRICNS
jgi:hypothetical protein